MRELPPLNALKAFEAAGRHLNFTRAAEELAVSQGAVAQHVRQLEARLGQKLFFREARGLTLTDAGRRFLPPVSRAFDMLAEASENLRPQEAVVTISTTPSFATRWLVPRLGAFAQAHPEIRIRIDASNDLANFQSDGVDIAIRQGRTAIGPGLSADLLFASDLIAVCHPDLLGQITEKPALEDLADHVLLEDSHGHWPLFLEGVFGENRILEMRYTQFSQTSMAIDAALAGQGIALTSRAFVEADLAANRLCQPIPATVQTDQGYYVVAPRKPRHPSTVSVVRNWLLSQVD
ncbi:LysR substrate-binding domain-containing protein [Primorskyibacter sp. S87]|uniref:LysR substrate-binding domain-containing protein n=1 Tax=Primorskyibacter sp. S87 TaxID=3415126 RepID=UPI003C7C8AC4